MRPAARAVLATLVLATLATACASSGGSSGPRRGSRYVISSEELAGLAGASAYEAIERLRPEWLRAAQPMSVTNAQSATPVVFVDRVEQGHPETLTAFMVAHIASITYLPAREATTVYGTGYPGGIIEVRTIDFR